MKCKHGVWYPAEDDDQEIGPWICRADGSNPDCAECETDPDHGFSVIFCQVSDDETCH